MCKQTNGCVRRPGGDTVRCLHAQGFVEGWEIRVANTTSGATVYRRIGANRNAAACSPIPSARPRPKPVLTKLSDVKPERVEWLWADRIPLGKLTLVAGDPGLGKSLVTCDIAARVSSGTPWPDRKSELGVAGSVILLSAEDDAADTIVPRLMAAGAIRENIRTLSGIVNLDGTRAVFTLEHGLQPLEIALEQSPGCRLVIIDPISAFLGRTDSHKNADLRALLGPLAELAARCHVAVVAVTHLSKSGGDKAIYRAIGSVAFTATARAVWLVARDPDDNKRRLFLPTKANLAPEAPGLAYHIGSRPVQEVRASLPVVVWETEPIRITADEALAAENGRRGSHDRSARDHAAAWLRELLSGGPVPAQDVKDAAASAGYAWRTIRRAEYELGVISRKIGMNAGWLWELPIHSREGGQTTPND